jgi:hypothetical protein
LTLVSHAREGVQPSRHRDDCQTLPERAVRVRQDRLGERRL